jgi:ring-1,2-phenylacetyl-CoA epoxidase subunit PaaC
LTTPLFDYALRLADDALLLGHRLSEWCGRAPMLEEDLALANIGLDLIGQARSLYT